MTYVFSGTLNPTHFTSLRSGRGCPLVVHCWADLQSVHGFRCYDNIQPANWQLMRTWQRTGESGEREMSASTCLHSLYAFKQLFGLQNRCMGIKFPADFTGKFPVGGPDRDNVPIREAVLLNSH